MLYVFSYYYQLNCLKGKIDTARKELEQTWEQSGKTDQQVLDAAEKVDLLINEYDRLVRESLELSIPSTEISNGNKFRLVKQFA